MLESTGTPEIMYGAAPKITSAPMAYIDMPDFFQILPEVVFEGFLLGCRNAGLLHIGLHFWYLLSSFSTPGKCHFYSPRYLMEKRKN